MLFHSPPPAETPRPKCPVCGTTQPRDWMRCHECGTTREEPQRTSWRTRLEWGIAILFGGLNVWASSIGVLLAVNEPQAPMGFVFSPAIMIPILIFWGPTLVLIFLPDKFDNLPRSRAFLWAMALPWLLGLSLSLLTIAACATAFPMRFH